jgi:hypothetical protein
MARLESAGHALLAQLVEHLHGKEGVSGSSPEEGFYLVTCKQDTSVVQMGAEQAVCERRANISEPPFASKGLSAGEQASAEPTLLSYRRRPNHWLSCVAED